MPTQINDRIVLVTGANSGIGKEVARQLAVTKRYGTVIIGARDATKGERAEAELEARTALRAFQVLQLDLSDSAGVRAAVGRLPGPIDDLVMNAGGFGGATPFAVTRDGVAEIIAANVLGHAVLLNELLDRRLLRRSAVFAGSEAARGVPSIGIKRPVLRDGSEQEFTAVCDGSFFRREKMGASAAYAWAKLTGALWMAHMARIHPERRLVTMSPGSTSGTAAMDVLPQPVRFLMTKVMAPYVFPLVGMAHGVEVGAKRLVDAVLEDRYRSGVFYASGKGSTGAVTDQAMTFPALGDAATQRHAAEALQRFVDATGRAAGDETRSVAGVGVPGAREAGATLP